MWFVPLIILVIVVLLMYYMSCINTAFRKLKESFNEDSIMDTVMIPDIDPESRYLYFTVVDVYKNALKREPDYLELDRSFQYLRDKSGTVDDLRNSLLKQGHVDLPKEEEMPDQKIIRERVREEIVRMMPDTNFYDEKTSLFINDMINVYRSTNSLRAVTDKIYESKEYEKYINNKQGTFMERMRIQKDTDTVHALIKLREYALLERFRNDQLFRDDAVKIFVDLDRDEDKFLRVIRQTYSPREVTRVDVPNSGVVALARPEIGKKTSIDIKSEKHAENTASTDKQTKKTVVKELEESEEPEEGSCEFYARMHMMSELPTRRNYEDLKNMCEMSKQYDNMKKDLTLLPDQKWSVPQKQPPICLISEPSVVHNSLSQTALIGTLLEESNPIIIPQYSETVASTRNETSEPKKTQTTPPSKKHTKVKSNKKLKKKN